MQPKPLLYLLSIISFSITLFGCASSKPASESPQPVATAVVTDGETSTTVQTDVTTPPQNAALITAEEMPMLHGGLRSIQRRIKYPKHLREQGVHGRVLAKFVVGIDGRVSNLEIIRSVHPELDRIAIEAISRARFDPGRNNGKPVPVIMSLPITFGI